MDQQIGSGAYGSITVGYVDDKRVAVKTFNDRIDWNEIDIMSNYEHPNIMKANLLAPGNRFYMEIGTPLTDIKLNKAEFMQLIHQSADGLAFLHSRGVVHLDIKPQNMVRVGDSYKFIDFGQSMISTPEKLTRGFTLPDVKGTRQYSPPENLTQISNYIYDTWKSTVSFSADVFGLAMLWVNMFVDMKDLYVKLAQSLYTDYVNDKGDMGFNAAVQHPGVLWYQLQKRVLYVKKARDMFVGKILGSLDLEDHIIPLISDMLSWKREERPTMKQVVKRLKISPSPGRFIVYIPRDISSRSLVDIIKSISGIHEFLYKWELDVVDLFRVWDMMVRTYGRFDNFIDLALQYSECNADNGEIKDKAGNSYTYRLETIDYEGETMMLRASLCSCNILYRLANSVESLVYVAKLNPSKVDFYELKSYIDQNFKPGDKTILISEFLQLLK